MRGFRPRENAMKEASTIGIRRKRGYTWISLPDTITMDNCPMVERKIEAEIRDGSGRIVLDMTRIAHLYSTGIGLLVRVKQKVDARGGTVALVNVSAPVRRLLDSVNLLKVFPVFATDVEFEITADEGWEVEEKERVLPFVCVTQVENGVVRVTLSGRMTAMEDLSSFNESLVRQNIHAYVFDLTGLEKIDTQAATMMSRVVSRIKESGGVCSSYGAGATVRDLLSLLSYDELLQCRDSEKAALAAVGAL